MSIFGLYFAKPMLFSSMKVATRRFVRHLENLRPTTPLLNDIYVRSRVMSQLGGSTVIYLVNFHTKETLLCPKIRHFFWKVEQGLIYPIKLIPLNTWSILESAPQFYYVFSQLIRFLGYFKILYIQPAVHPTTSPGNKGINVSI